MTRRLLFFPAAVLFITACASRSTATPFTSPTSPPGVTFSAPEPLTPNPFPLSPTGIAASTPTPAQIVPPLGADLCTPDLLFVADATVPDGTQFKPGETIDKRWTVRNSGSCAWGPEFRVVLVGGDAMGASAELALYPALPGAEGIVRAQLTAPGQPGDYVGTWQARDPEGKLFGNKMWVRITVSG
ncbi:MAG: hypothetical protein HY023_14505 [Chloroflexi bacterium]|nr:hypothetical protein [Chloroflexota bacterium]MBI3762210.1 hypothetical protein [Chloroflexota bacterium]